MFEEFEEWFKRDFIPVAAKRTAAFLSENLDIQDNTVKINLKYSLQEMETIEELGNIDDVVTEIFYVYLIVIWRIIQISM